MQAGTARSLEHYFAGFANARQPWPALPLADMPEIAWWRDVIAAGRPDDGWIHALTPALPQLLMPQEVGVNKSERYRALVLLGESPEAHAVSAVPWSEPLAFTLHIADHPCGAFPVISSTNRGDFERLLRALAFRCEPVTISSAVHAQAIGGLIHWGLIQRFGRESRAQIILLDQGPYGSVSAVHVPGTPSESQWIAASTVLRLEHELTHLAVKRVVGEMRVNLLDELIADTMGMRKALGFFSAQLFRRCLGVHDDDSFAPAARVNTYLTGLSEPDAAKAVSLCMRRAIELEDACGNIAPDTNPMQVLRWLTRQRLDQAIEKFSN